MSFKEIIESEKEKIIKELRENGYSNKTVDYSQFLSLCPDLNKISLNEV